MKQETLEPQLTDDQLQGPRYWRSLEERIDSPEFKDWLHREFPQGASEAEGVNRRHFLKIMGASFAFAGLGVAGCRRPEEHILPYALQPENIIPGLPTHFATSFPGGLDNVPLVVETHQNRPTHIEGNSRYEPYGGGINPIISASVLDLYDPDRMTASTRRTAGTGTPRRVRREDVFDHLTSLGESFGRTGGQGLAVLAAPSSSPTRRRLMQQMRQRFPRMIWAEYEPLRLNSAERAASGVFETPVRPLHHLTAARRILSLDADFLNAIDPGSPAMARDYARGRRVRNREDAAGMNRLYQVEGPFTVTGSMADHRLRLSSAQIPALAALVAAEVLEQTGGEVGFVNALRQQGAGLEAHTEWVRTCVEDLIEHEGESVVLAGAHLPDAVHQLVVLINARLGAEGKTVSYLDLPATDAVTYAELLTAVQEGRVETLLVLGGNPGFNAPSDQAWSEVVEKVPEVIRHGYYFDETGLDATWSIASTHYLESWSDGRTYDGTYVPVQPMILPLFEGISEIELLSRLAGNRAGDAYDTVLETFAGLFGGGIEGARRDFAKVLSEGFHVGSSYPRTTATVVPTRVMELVSGVDLQAPEANARALSIRLLGDPKVRDGSFANNGWLQELPDPITKICWDNAILVSPALASELGYDTKTGKFLIGGIGKARANFVDGREQAPVGELELDGITLRGPIHIQPGLPDWEVVLPLGYGRRRTGRVGSGVGFDAYPLLRSDSGLVRSGASLRILADEWFPIANTQNHWSMEGRSIVREGNVSMHLEDPAWAQHIGIESHAPPNYGKDKDLPLSELSLTQPRGHSAYKTPDFGKPPPSHDVWKTPEAAAAFIPDQQWGMSIDLNACTGCNTCVVACQSENNIPIVGKEQVLIGREMSWIRLDRYYSSGSQEQNQISLPADPQASLMPVGCLHCEMAPCETVCPVNATVHDTQGLNVMAYNRCVGTRYCANNCPYKVRRFNFFDYNKRATDEFYLGPLGRNQYKTEGGILASMQKNPDVSVRMRGVMEKCTYCVQRIQQARIAQRVVAKDSNNIHIPDRTFKVACEAACPTEAIIFGDVSNPESAVSRAKDNDRDYALLGYLNTRPRTTYLARLRNPNPRMPDYTKVPLSLHEYKERQPAGSAH